MGVNWGGGVVYVPLPPVGGMVGGVVYVYVPPQLVNWGGMYYCGLQFHLRGMPNTPLLWLVPSKFGKMTSGSSGMGVLVAYKDTVQILFFLLSIVLF